MTSLANKDEALKCLEVADKALRANNVTKAERFCEKAERLYQCDEVRIFKRKLAQAVGEGQQSETTNAEPSATSVSESASTVRQRGARQSTSDTASTKPKATKEQEALVDKILKAKDFYDILSVPKDATEDDVKKSYRKLALRLHPDKNSAHRAEEAFKAVSRAFSCLSDSEKRRNYNQFGHEDQAQAAAAHGRQFYADEIDPQEIFNMFFGGGFPMHGHGRVYRTHFGNMNYRRRNQGNHQNQQNTQTHWSALLHIVPLAIFLLFTVMNGPQDSPPYSLVRSRGYGVEMRTQNRNIPFFVPEKRTFNENYPYKSSARGKLEGDVELNLRRYLHSHCEEEKLKQYRAQMWYGSSAAKKIPLEACQQYNTIFSDGKTVTVQ